MSNETNQKKKPHNAVTPAAREDKHIALIVHSTKLLPTEPGLDRAAYIAALLSEAGYHVDVITSAFQHWGKSHRNTSDHAYIELPYNVVFIDEPGYKKNIDPSRIWSHHVYNRNLRAYLKEQSGYYDAVWSHIPPNNIAATAATFARSEEIPLIVDVNDLWPEAMRMVIDIPVISDIAFSPMERDARRTYEAAWGAVGTSEEYAAHPNTYRASVQQLSEDRMLTVFVGNDLARFDTGASEHPVEKPDSELWVTYAGTLGKSYDIATLLDAFDIASATLKSEGFPNRLRLQILGDGPDREELVSHAMKCANAADIEFLGYVEYEKMAGYLCASDIVVNSLVANAPQSIVSKVGDYLASGSAMISTSGSDEMKALVEVNGVGVNVEPESVGILARVLCEMAQDEDGLRTMSSNARKLAEEKFDRAASYPRIVEFMDTAVFGTDENQGCVGDDCDDNSCK